MGGATRDCLIMKVSKVLAEVWRWKDEVGRDIESITSAQQIAYFRGTSGEPPEKTDKKLDLPRASRRRR